MRLLGAEAATFSLDENGLSVKTKSDDTYVVLTESLSGKAVCVNGVFFSKLILKTDKGTKKFGGLRKRDAAELYLWMRHYWIEQLTQIVVDAAQQIKVVLGKGYFRTASAASPVAQGVR
jgi:hypothetical protein